MVNVSLTSDSVVNPGFQDIVIEVESDNYSEGFTDSISIKLNGIEVSWEISGSLGDWQVTTSQDLMGPQDMEITISATDDDGQFAQVLLLSIQTSLQLRDYERSVWSAYINDLAGYFPEYSKARGDANSVAKQMLNPIGLELDDLKTTAIKVNKNLNFRESEVEDLDWLYRYELGLGEQFQTAQDSAGDLYYQAPTIYGLRGVNRLPVEVKGSVKALVKAVPSRLVAEERGTTHTRLSPSIGFKDLGALRAFKLSSPGWLYYEIHSVVGTIDLEGTVPVLRLVLVGEGPGKITQTESLRASFPGVYQTTKRWHKVERAYITGGLEDSEGEVIFYEAPPRKRIQADNRIRHTNGRTIYWSLKEDEEGSFVDQDIRTETLILDTIKQQDTSDILSRHRLLDVSGDGVLITDLCIDNKSLNMVGVSEDSLLIWDRRQEFCERLALLNSNSENAEQTFFLDVYEQPYANEGLYSEIRVELDTPKSANTIFAWRWAINDSDGVLRYLDEEKAIVDSGPNWLYNKSPIERFGINERAFSIEVQGVGTWIVTLFVLLEDGTEQSYSKAISIIGNSALAQIKLPELEGFDSSDAGIQVLPNGNYLLSSLGKTWILRKQFDLCVVDYEDKSIFFKDNFDSVEMNFNEQ